MSRVHEEGKTGFAATFRPLLDDRQRPARRITKNDLTRASRSDNPGIQSIAGKLKQAIKSEQRRITPDRIVLTVVALFGVFILSGVINGLMLPVIGLGDPGIGVLVFIGLIVAAHIVIRAYVRRGTLNQLARTAVAEGVCGSCAFPLQAVPVADDGCMTCPECGASWRADRVIEPFWEKPAADRLRSGFWPAITPGVLPKANLFAPDDRGRFVQTPDSRLMRVPKDVRAGIPRDEWRRIRRSTRMSGIIWRWVLFLVLIWLPLLGATGAVTAAQDEEFGLMWFLIVLTTTIGVPILLIPFSAAFSTPHRTSRAIVRRGRCACCLTSLADAETDREGRARCVTCASAWLTSEVQQKK